MFAADLPTMEICVNNAFKLHMKILPYMAKTAIYALMSKQIEKIDELVYEAVTLCLLPSCYCHKTRTIVFLINKTSCLTKNNHAYRFIKQRETTHLKVEGCCS